MQIRLSCPGCFTQFAVPDDSPEWTGLNRLTEEGPWSVLGDGETFEDSLSRALNVQGGIHCPQCGELVSVSEEKLGRMTLELLAQW
jgi:hypothetical protein